MLIWIKNTWDAPRNENESWEWFALSSGISMHISCGNRWKRKISMSVGQRSITRWTFLSKRRCSFAIHWTQAHGNMSCFMWLRHMRIWSAQPVETSVSCAANPFKSICPPCRPTDSRHPIIASTYTDFASNANWRSKKARRGKISVHQWMNLNVINR